MRLRLLMRHLLSHRNFEEAAYYKYCMKRPLSVGPVLRGGRTASPSLTVPQLVWGPDRTLYEKQGRTHAREKDTVYSAAVLSSKLV